MSLKEKREQKQAAINDSARRLDELSRDIILNPDDEKLHGQFINEYNSAMKGGLKEKDVLPATWAFAQNFMSNQAGTLEELRKAKKSKLTSEGYPQQVINRELASIGQKVKEDKGLTAAPPIQYQLVGNSGGTTTSTQQPENHSAQTFGNNPSSAVTQNNAGNNPTAGNNPSSVATQKPQTKYYRNPDGTIAITTLPYERGSYQEKKTVKVDPETTTKTSSLNAPDEQMQEYIRRNVIEPLQRTYGVNPQTGAITPFEALGYNPEDERKRREAERALNDRKRKENAWYNAFAVLGDSLTAALGGNVWQRQPNNIGAQANADNARLIAEQKAEDEGNAAKLRAAGTAYANTVNQLIQNYLTKTTTTNKTGGDRTEITDHPAIQGYRTQSHTLRNSKDRDGKSGGGRSSKKVIKLAKKDKAGNVIGYTTMTVPAIEADAYSRLVSTTMQQKFENGELQGELDALRKAGIYNPAADDITKRWNADKLLTYGRSFYTDALNTEIEQLWKQADEYNGKPINWRPWDIDTPAMHRGGGWGTVPGVKTDSLDFDWK